MKNGFLAIVAASLLVGPITANASVFVENEHTVPINDTLATASDLTGLGGTISVSGTILAPGLGVDDNDFYKIHVTGGSSLVLSVLGPSSGSLSPNGGTLSVALFDSSGLLLAYDNNNPSAGPTNPARIDPYSIATTGFYYVTTMEWSEHPNALLGSPVYTPLANAGFAISNVGPDATIADTGGKQHPGESYSLTISGASGVIPEPSTLAIWSVLGAIGLAVGNRRRKA